MSVSKEKQKLREIVDLLLINKNYQGRLMLNDDIDAEDMIGLMGKGAISEKVFHAVKFCRELIQEEKSTDGSAHKKWKQPTEAFINNINLLDYEFDYETVRKMLEYNPQYGALPGDLYIRKIKFKLEDQIKGFVHYIFDNGVKNPHKVHINSTTDNLNHEMYWSNSCLFKLVAKGACIENTIEAVREFMLSKEMLHTLREYEGKAVKIYVDSLLELGAFSNTELQMFQLE